MTAPRPLATAAVGGFPAWVLTPALRHAVATLPLTGVPPEYVRELRRTLAAIEEVGARWQAWRASVDGSVSVPVTEAVAELPHEITTDEAAALLKVSAARVRQLCRLRVLAARKAGRTWWVESGSVLMLIEKRRSAA